MIDEALRAETLINKGSISQSGNIRKRDEKYVEKSHDKLIDCIRANQISISDRNSILQSSHKNFANILQLSYMMVGKIDKSNEIK